MSDLVVVGAGLYGLTVAQQAAVEGLNVTLVDRRDYVGGNAYSYFDDNGIEIHKYGAHLFHTSNKRVWDYVNKFTSFTGYRHQVYTNHSGIIYPMPISLATINQFFRQELSPDGARAFIAMQRRGLDPDKATNLEEKAIALVGEELYNAFIRGYTAKQWQTDPRDLPASVISRLPVRYTYNTRYFNDKFEGLPTNGYAHWFENMVDNKRINVQLGVDFFKISSMIVGQVPVVYTGPIDRYFNYTAGNLGWRTVDFTIQTLDTQDYLGTSVMNYADEEVPWTRIIEFKHFHPERESFHVDKTTIAHEYSRFASVDDEPYYPINSTSDRDTLNEYKRLAEQEQHDNKIYFGGRLGNYAYLDMWQAINSALHFSDKIL